jgi:hypothetical protein
LGVYAHYLEDLRAHVQPLAEIVREVTQAAEITPLEVWRMGPGARIITRPFSWEQFDAFVLQEDTSHISLSIARDLNTRFTVGADLRGKHRGIYPPDFLDLMILIGPEGVVGEEVAARAAELLLRRAAERLPVMQGGAHAYEKFDDAGFEPQLHGTETDKQPPHIQARWQGERKVMRHIREKPRRIYWRTLLGRKMAATVGGAAAARAAGAELVEEIDGSLLFGVGALPSEALRADYGERTRGLRQWIWPHSIQNPVDAVDDSRGEP